MKRTQIKTQKGVQDLNGSPWKETAGSFSREVGASAAVELCRSLAKREAVVAVPRRFTSPRPSKPPATAGTLSSPSFCKGTEAFDLVSPHPTPS